MDFGRLDDLGRVDWQLPEDAARTDRVLAASASIFPRANDRRPIIRVGAPRWGVKQWLGVLYPKTSRPTEYLRHYGQRFAAVELNATFYQIPSEKTILRWREMVPEPFRFCPKLPRKVSHSSGLDPGGKIRRTFFEAVRQFGGRLGPCFLMLPPRFAPSQLEVLERFLDTVPDDIRLAVEFRHPGYFLPEAAERTFALLESRGVAAVITDTAGRRDALHMCLTTPTAFVRFVGNAPDTSDRRRITDWIDRIARWAGSGLEELYFFIHQREEHGILELAEQMEANLSDRGLFVSP
jgi:uncharacterized protein YecE (DUF72 family)